MELRQYNVTVRRFDPTNSAAEGEFFILPVDSPDEEHAISAAMSNCVAFTSKFASGTVQSIAFICTAVAPR